MSAQTTIKQAIRKKFTASGLTRRGFGKLLKVADQEVTRILDEGHNTRLDRLEEAAGALGLKIKVTVK